MLRGSVVPRLVNNLQSEFSFNITFDNLFIFLAWLNHLLENGIGGTDILRANRADHCPIEDIKVIGKKDHESYDYRYDSAIKLIVIRSNGDSVVTLASNCQPVTC